MQRSYHRPRQRDRGAAIIILVSVLVMVLLLCVFFGTAMQRGTDGDNSPPPVQSDTTASTEPADRDTDDVPLDTAIPAVRPTETEDAETTEQTTETVTEAVTEAPKPPKTPDIIPVTYNAELLAEVALPAGEAPEGYVDSLVFYGDSTTHGMKAYKVFGSRDTKQVWTPQSGTLALFRAATDLVWDPGAGKDKSLTDLCADNKPAYLIITLGVNGISFMDRDSFKTDYQNVINIIRASTPDTKLILQSIYPVARSYEKQESINNKKIQAGNEWIVELASENGLPYLNTYSVLVGEDGYLPEAYQNGDGMHFNEVGFAAVMDYIKTHPCT